MRDVAGTDYRIVDHQSGPHKPGIPGGENFLYVFKPGRHGPDAPPLAPASARSRLRLRERAGRLARAR
jgi:hypothetical protein